MIPSAVVLVALVALVLSAMLGVLRRPILAGVRSLEPRKRVRWLLAALALPSVAGLVLISLAVGHCVLPRLIGLADDCNGAGWGCAFCLFAPGPGGWLTWMLAALSLLPVSLRLARTVRDLSRAQKAHRILRGIAHRTSDGSWRVPGTGAFVVGWPTPAVFIGEELTEHLDDASMQAVAAHEQAHKSHGDVTVRVCARLLAATQFPTTARWLLEELDLSIEQACDERASAAVKDPLIVAQALIETARLQLREHADEGACAPNGLDARISALCNPVTPAYAPAWMVVVQGTLVLLVLAGLGMSHHIHRAAESISHLVNR